MITRNKSVCRREHSLKNAPHCSVSNVSYIDNETMKHSKNNATQLETKCETVDIKALALQVVQRKGHNKNETVRETQCETEIKISETPIKQKHKIEDLLYQFEERISIMVFDGKVNEMEATNQAFLEIIKNNF